LRPHFPFFTFLPFLPRVYFPVLSPLSVVSSVMTIYADKGRPALMTYAYSRYSIPLYLMFVNLCCWIFLENRCSLSPALPSSDLAEKSGRCLSSQSLRNQEGSSSVDVAATLRTARICTSLLSVAIGAPSQNFWVGGPNLRPTVHDYVIFDTRQ